jgi:hypothetical protein
MKPFTFDSIKRMLIIQGHEFFTLSSPLIIRMDVLTNEAFLVFMRKFRLTLSKKEITIGN